MSRRAVIALALTLVVLTIAGAALAAGPPVIVRHVIGGGGGVVSTADYTLRSTIGQSVAGHVIQVDTDLCAGYWCMPIRYEVMLPLVVRG